MTLTTSSPKAVEASTPAETETSAVTVAELVGTTLARLGVGHVFGVVGSGNFVVTNALRRAGVPFTAARHEGGAATMADAYGRMSGKLGVATTHQGCGLTNAVTGIGEAAKSRTPMIVVTADTAASATRSNFNIDQDALAISVGAVAARVHSAETAVADTVRAYRTAVNQRRTVVLSLPTDIQSERVVEERDQPGPLDPPQRVRPSEAAVSQLAGLLQSAKRPVFVVGRGGREAGPEIAALAESVGALLATSAVAHGLFNGNPYNLGISGGFSSPFTAKTIAEADLIVGWGCALNMWTMRHGSLISESTIVVQVDLEDSALGANRPIDLGILGDCAETAVAVLTDVQSGGYSAIGLRTLEMAQRIAEQARWNSVETSDISTDETIDPRVLSRELDRMLPANRIISVDSGNFMGYPSTYLSVPDEYGFCFTQAFQSIGLGLSTAIGASVARPDRLPILGTGDGGFLMAISELETAVRERIPLVAIVYNDSAYGAEVHHFDADDADLEVVRFPIADIASIAAGYGAAAVTVRRLEDLTPVGEWLSGSRQAPLVIDARIASDGGAWWLAEAFKGH
ncbi:thiamine pyrophosphate-binding protein [Paenarthrobacter sp.]|uniref:thiamine pyrophosphate-binding protein n=1 Tax=Paenarthrobacter sp. TaxID=1931993 RepID=UPI002811B5D9|nr:thiamine pyrophosphate-binding protein [Paenarthrobacter sp.]